MKITKISLKYANKIACCLLALVIVLSSTQAVAGPFGLFGNRGQCESCGKTKGSGSVKSRRAKRFERREGRKSNKSRSNGGEYGVYSSGSNGGGYSTYEVAPRYDEVVVYETITTTSNSSHGGMIEFNIDGLQVVPPTTRIRTGPVRQRIGVQPRVITKPGCYIDPNTGRKVCPFSDNSEIQTDLAGTDAPIIVGGSGSDDSDETLIAGTFAPVIYGGSPLASL